MSARHILLLGSERVALFARSGDGWRGLGEVSTEASDLEERVAALRAAAGGEGLQAQLVFDETQGHLVTLDDLTPEAHAITEALEEALPYPVSQAIAAREATEGRTRFRVLPRALLREAEAFAARMGFAATGFAAIWPDRPDAAPVDLPWGDAPAAPVPSAPELRAERMSPPPPRPAPQGNAALLSLPLLGGVVAVGVAAAAIFGWAYLAGDPLLEGPAVETGTVTLAQPEPSRSDLPLATGSWTAPALTSAAVLASGGSADALPRLPGPLPSLQEVLLAEAPPLRGEEVWASPPVLQQVEASGTPPQLASLDTVPDRAATPPLDVLTTSDAAFGAPADPPAPPPAVPEVSDDTPPALVAEIPSPDTPAVEAAPEVEVVSGTAPDLPDTSAPTLAEPGEDLVALALAQAVGPAVSVNPGAPAVTPRPRPEGEPEEAGPAVAVNQGTPAVRPQRRPGDPEILYDPVALAENIAALLETQGETGPRPRARGEALDGLLLPDTAAIEDILAAVNAQSAFVDPTEAAVEDSPRPDARPSNFATVVANALLRQQQRPTPTPAARLPEAVSIPVPQSSGSISASVARAATQENEIALRDVALVGVFGSAGNRRALVRLPNGKFERVGVGDSLDGGRVTSIGQDTLNYTKRGRTISLEIPGE